MKETDQRPSDPMARIWTLPNVISYVRVVLLLPLALGLIASSDFAWALTVLAVLGSTDWLDGYLARRLDQCSKLGEELDPIADRASITLVSISLTVVGVLPWPLLALIVGVDLVLLAVATLIFNGHPPAKVNLVGKVRTAFLLVGLPLLMLASALDNQTLRTVALTIVAAGAVIHCAAGAGYLLQMSRAVRQTSPTTSRQSGFN